MNVIASLEFKLADSDLTVQHVSHYTTETPPYYDVAVQIVSKYATGTTPPDEG